MFTVVAKEVSLQSPCIIYGKGVYMEKGQQEMRNAEHGKEQVLYICIVQESDSRYLHLQALDMPVYETISHEQEKDVNEQ